ncbi:uncharacterized protein METZ01_LOCUS102683 [marine metagenome]|uniref:(S)-ureidoglycine aminohydrolase cupin domain-containing protein n=1 Tax=marine metagenome TaxID=408172 RepID=A0A381WBA8_9ZZZZ
MSYIFTTQTNHGFTMKQFILFIFLILNLNGGIYSNLHAADLTHLDKSVFADLINTEFESYNAGYGELTVREYELFTSEDENFSIGIWEAKRGEEVMDTPYPYNEFMYVLFGQMVIKNSDGQDIIINPGQGFITPKDWMGSLTITEDLAIIYAIDGLKGTKNAGPINSVKINDARVSVYDLGDFEPYYPKYSNLLARGITLFSNQDESFQVGIWESSSGSIPASAEYFHGYHEFMYPLSGSIRLSHINGQVSVTNPGEGVLIPSNWDGEFAVPEGILKIWISYTETATTKK